MRDIQHCISPIDGLTYVSRLQADDNKINQTLAQATMAQTRWNTMNLRERKELCRHGVSLFAANKDEIAAEISWMMGRPIRYSVLEVEGFCERALAMIDMADTALAPIKPPPIEGYTRYISREALGVVLVIAPWNYPYLTAVNTIIPALLSGNSVILKPSSQTPLCAERLFAAFAQAGLPQGVFQYLHMSHAKTHKVIRSQVIDHVAFTGSVKGGASIEAAATGQFIGVGLELGGKDPAYVRADARLDAAVETLMDGAFFNSGQSCCAIERIYVNASVYDEFLQKSVDLVKQYQLGRSDDMETTLGPMVRTQAADAIREQVRHAISLGAVPHIDEGLFPRSQGGTPYLAPQILTQVDHRMPLMTQESFGPVIGIQKVHHDDEAIELMNDSEFGLSASIFTQDIPRGITLGEQIQTGTFFINRCDYLDPQLAWTGVKQSGRGCTLSELGFSYLTRPKSFNIKHL